jgi:hypothetical protein
VRLSRRAQTHQVVSVSTDMCARVLLTSRLVSTNINAKFDETVLIIQCKTIY